MNKHMQYDRKTWNQTFASVHYKSMNILTKQAGEITQYMDPLLDGLLITVRRRIGKLSLNHVSVRRNTSITVCSMGTKRDCTDGFSNTNHVDLTDKYGRDVQTEIKHILLDYDEKGKHDALRNECGLARELYYLRELIEVCSDNVSTSTTIGYDFVDANNNASKGDKIHADFMMIGLGVSVRMCPSLYHNFYGSAFVHSTALPITQSANGNLATYASKFNVFAWGIAKPMNNVDDSNTFYDPKSYIPNRINTVDNLNRVLKKYKKVV